MRVLLLGLVLLCGCNLLSGEVACERRRDCPASLPFCTGHDDAGVGTCAEDAEVVDAGPSDAG